MDNRNQQLEQVARALVWCFVLTMGLLLFWWIFYLVAGDWGYGIHAKMFDITKREFDLVMYCGMAFVKVVAIVLFLVPYISLRLVLRDR